MFYSLSPHAHHACAVKKGTPPRPNTHRAGQEIQKSECRQIHPDRVVLKHNWWAGFQCRCTRDAEYQKFSARGIPRRYYQL